MAVASGILSIWHATPEQAADGVRALGPDLSAASSSDWVSATRPWSNCSTPPTPGPTAGWSTTWTGSTDRGRRSDRTVGCWPPSDPACWSWPPSAAAGAHPYFVPVEHVARARDQLGPDTYLAPELAVVLDPDPATARATAREYTRGYLGLPNYVNNLRTLGFGDDDVEGAGSDRLVDAVIAWGDVDRIAERVRQFHDAGADHVCIQVVADRAGGFPLEAYRALAPALLG